MHTLSDVAAQFGTSVQVIEKHHLAQLSDPKAVEVLEPNAEEFRAGLTIS